MKQMLLLLLAAIVVFSAAGLTLKSLKTNQLKLSGGAAMKITSPAFNDGADIPVKYTCDGENINPPLEFGDIPSGTKSLCLIVDDPDSPSGNFVHWLIWNLNPSLPKIEEKSVPENSIQGTTGFGLVGFGGPCPASGKHHYRFNVYALDIKLDLPNTTKKDQLEEAIKDHILGRGTLTGLYQRQ